MLIKIYDDIYIDALDVVALSPNEHTEDGKTWKSCIITFRHGVELDVPIECKDIIDLINTNQKRSGF